MGDKTVDIIHELENMTDITKEEVLRRATHTDLEMFIKFFNKHTMKPQTKIWVEEVLRKKEEAVTKRNYIMFQIVNAIIVFTAVAAIFLISQKFIK